jgi:hypothetical protein
MSTAIVISTLMKLGTKDCLRPTCLTGTNLSIQPPVLSDVAAIAGQSAKCHANIRKYLFRRGIASDQVRAIQLTPKL